MDIAHRFVQLPIEGTSNVQDQCTKYRTTCNIILVDLWEFFQYLLAGKIISPSISGECKCAAFLFLLSSGSTSPQNWRT